jgi:aspartate racemase
MSSETTGGAPATRWRRVGVLGGMGPAATVDFYAKLVEETDAHRDQEHVPIMVWGDPRVPDRSDHLLGSGPDPRPALRTGIDALVAAGCEVLAVPCNTAHAYVGRLAEEAGVELVHLVEVAAEHLAASGARCAGILATTGTVRSELYAEALRRRGIETVAPGPEDQETVMEAIRAVKGGQSSEHETAAVTAVGRRLVAAGADVVVAGCTEIVLVLDPAWQDARVVDPARLLARRVIARAREVA